MARSASSSRQSSSKSSRNGNGSANLGFEAKLWLAADKLRNNMDDSDNALRTSGCPHREATMQSVSETKDNFHEDDDHA